MDEGDFEAFAEAYGAAWDFHRQLSDRALVNPYLVARPDWVAARMAFRDAYQREVERAQLARLPVLWVVSPGNDRRLLVQAVQDAVRDGLLPASAGVPYLVGHAAEGSLVPLIEGAKASGNERAISALAELRLRLARPPTADYDLDAVRAACAVRDLEQTLAACQGVDDDRQAVAG